MHNALSACQAGSGHSCGWEVHSCVSAPPPLPREAMKVAPPPRAHTAVCSLRLALRDGLPLCLEALLCPQGHQQPPAPPPCQATRVACLPRILGQRCAVCTTRRSPGHPPASLQPLEVKDGSMQERARGAGPATLRPAGAGEGPGGQRDHHQGSGDPPPQGRHPAALGGGAP